ncbi:Myb-like DNA-binding domain containing protein [Trichomonas vaginalis G3]|uniref:Myb-like DNA-binding domain containing protein n=1 Tax=Trichomonas vaginalis (strain ATCC PRA-98 / G3) TaxID=412133 RepID=A2EFA3_TRIV3|nr:RNA polymerase II transcription regulator recruiting protein [Trichomonas vaginalis G3]EAY08713.1 Myb-like DNA-binding domain containing protein [Trichomonas vaginalis G3]KAI5492840.1 RNA polymerase II transcription regulator recruiting protein [Trichomonas vaginalis G3]|eukprot:XP_001320936.1 Myb-like DNA-binding domain containing protein [Trichomonas vaginalis G3]
MNYDMGFSRISDTVADLVSNTLKPEDYTDEPSAKENLETVFKQYSSHIIDIDQLKELCRPYLKDVSRLDPIIHVIMLAVPQMENHTTNRRKSKPWTPEEDQRLSEAVAIHGTNQWGNVASIVGNDRTRSQCSQRWNRVIDPRISKANWTQEEEEKLLRIVAQVGDRQWTRVAAEMGNRCDVQCRFKYRFIMSKRNKAENEMRMAQAAMPQQTNLNLDQMN